MLAEVSFQEDPSTEAKRPRSFPVEPEEGLNSGRKRQGKGSG